AAPLLRGRPRSERGPLRTRLRQQPTVILSPGSPKAAEMALGTRSPNAQRASPETGRGPSTWEPPVGIEPTTYALRVWREKSRDVRRRCLTWVDAFQGGR